MTICYHYEKQFEVSFQCVCPVIDNEVHHNIVKVHVVCRFTLLHHPQLLWQWSVRGHSCNTDINLLSRVFSQHHSSHFCLPRKWNSCHVAVSNQPCGSWTICIAAVNASESTLATCSCLILCCQTSVPYVCLKIWTIDNTRINKLTSVFHASGLIFYHEL